MFIDDFPDERMRKKERFSFQELTNDIILHYIKQLPDGAKLYLTYMQLVCHIRRLQKAGYIRRNINLSTKERDLLKTRLRI